MTVEQTTRAICPQCHAQDSSGPRWLPAELVADGERIWLRRVCPEHGEVVSLYEEDAELWRARWGWTVPPRSTQPDRPGLLANQLNVYSEGLPANHGQHTCILVLNLTDACNLVCGTCFASAEPSARADAGRLPSQQQILHTVRTAARRDGGKLDVVMLSGGEPTLRDDLPDIIDRLAELPITRIMVNTNGLRLASDDRLLARLAAHRAHLEVYLQFDGLRPATSQALRGRDLTAIKRSALARLNAAGVATTLVTTVVRGLNEDELGDILQLGLETPYAAGWAIQPVFGSGRGVAIDPCDRVTSTGIIRRLAEQSAGLLGRDDFIPLPCSHPDCCDLAYLVRDADDQWQSLIGLVGREQLHRWLPLLGNTITFEELSAPVMAALSSGSAPADHGLARACCCVPNLSALLGGLFRRAQREPVVLAEASRRAFRITSKLFQDAHTFREERLRQCCVHTATFEDDPRRHSFCWRWLFGDGPLPGEPC